MASVTLITSLKSLSLNIVTVGGTRVSTNGFGEGGETIQSMAMSKFFVFQIKKLKLSFHTLYSARTKG